VCVCVCVCEDGIVIRVSVCLSVCLSSHQSDSPLGSTGWLVVCLAVPDSLGSVQIVTSLPTAGVENSIAIRVSVCPHIRVTHRWAALVGWLFV